jgi:hypothetical protein
VEIWSHKDGNARNYNLYLVKEIIRKESCMCDREREGEGEGEEGENTKTQDSERV